MITPAPVVVLAGLDDVDLEVAAAGALCDLPGHAGIRLGLDVSNPAAVRLTWRVADAQGLVEASAAPVGGGCANCRVREAMTDLLERLGEHDRWEGFVVALPAGVEPMPSALRLTRGHTHGAPLAHRFRLCHVVAVVGDASVADQVFRPVDEHDEGEAELRSRRELLLSQVEFADTVVTAGTPSPTDAALLRHLARPGAALVDGLSALDGRALVEPVHDIHRALAHADPRSCSATGAAAAHDVATVEVRSWKPFHPQRLRDRFEQLAMSRGRCRGAFWLPGRPDVVMVIDAVAGSIGLGGAGTWEGRERGSHLVVTCPEMWADDLRACLQDALMTDAEMVGARADWERRCDGFEAWAGRHAGGAA